MTNPSWVDLVRECQMRGVDLTAHHMGHTSRDNLKGYNIWGACVTEVQVDVLTGQMSILRSDLMEDREEPGEMFDKEDMSDMFSRAMLEKMQPEGML